MTIEEGFKEIDASQYNLASYKQYLYEVDGESFILRLSGIDKYHFYGRVFPVAWCDYLGHVKPSGWEFMSKSVGGDTYSELNDDCRMLFDFTYRWRGEWEGRIYFKDDEYWCEELSTMSKIWEFIESVLKTQYL